MSASVVSELKLRRLANTCPNNNTLRVIRKHEFLQLLPISSQQNFEHLLTIVKGNDEQGSIRSMWSHYLGEVSPGVPRYAYVCTRETFDTGYKDPDATILQNEEIDEILFAIEMLKFQIQNSDGDKVDPTYYHQQITLKLGKIKNILRCHAKKILDSLIIFNSYKIAYQFVNE